MIGLFPFGSVRFGSERGVIRLGCGLIRLGCGVIWLHEAAWLGTVRDMWHRCDVVNALSRAACMFTNGSIFSKGLIPFEASLVFRFTAGTAGGGSESGWSGRG